MTRDPWTTTASCFLWDEDRKDYPSMTDAEWEARKALSWGVEYNHNPSGEQDWIYDDGCTEAEATALAAWLVTTYPVFAEIPWAEISTLVAAHLATTK